MNGEGECVGSTTGPTGGDSGGDGTGLTPSSSSSSSSTTTVTSIVPETTPTLQGDTNPISLSPDPAEINSPSGGRTVVIGENMGRVSSFADQYGYEHFETASPPSQWLQENAAWLNSQMDEGNTVIDIGPAPANVAPEGNFPYITSDYYAMEQSLLAARNYARWIIMWGVID